MTFTVVIPSRYASSRLPGKPLLDIGGKPMLQHVYERAVASGAKRVLIATDDDRVRQAGQGFGAQVEMTDAAHRSGTERIAEVVERLGLDPDSIVVNVQGDEPLLPPTLVTQTAETLAGDGNAQMATLCELLDDSTALFDPGVVKVVMDDAGYALFFSRAPIPWHRDAFASAANSLPTDGTLYYRHIGIYAYRVGYLKRYVSRVPGELEQAESLEQLRALAAGDRIRVAQAREKPGPGVDTPEDLAMVRALLTASG